ncbi:sulfatase-like hydrolase/transferase [Cyclobacterium sp. 1_MG-2023]|uniref:sulfatase-like hydrolase/transferase n=1 Tax=Cyclobacterium sp. 1_MG-2023 TaxID=3062681 RepID=UPI0026E238D6|nr:sulfatase-like hydrolase/transferase [Cyclobacterium sp. 1_MG-2023]MDO6435961.1 sulfatase-like hydrolase/transferase [Cyclobacterium sp. 1_MG-2023]
MKNALVLLILISCSLTLLNAQDKPNIILIMADDLGYEALEAYGNDFNKTPQIDKMIAKGMKFENTHSMPLCTPSRVQLMTGKYNFRNYLGFGILDPKESTFGHLLKAEGYATCIVGKWQLYGNEVQRKLANGQGGSLPLDAGFDKYRLWQVKDLGSRYKDPLLDSRETGVEFFEGKYGPDLFVDYMEDFMENQGNKPFFVYYPMVLTHDPFEPVPASNAFASYDPKTRLNHPELFPDMVTHMDHLIGRIIKKVNDLGIAENTLILFIGDNGTDRDVVSTVNGKQLRGNKGYTNDLGTHVPMIAYWPGTIKEGSVNNNLIDFTDFVPTLMDVAGAKNKKSFTDGISFYPQLTGKHNIREVREWVFCHYDPNWGKFAPRTFVHDTKYKLYQNGEIYNLKEDLYEKDALKKNDLNKKEKKIISKFEKVLDEMNLSEGD